MNKLLLVLTFSLVLAFGEISADQTATELPQLFEELSQAQSSTESAVIENKIWRLWLNAPDTNAQSLMSQVVGAMQSGQLTLALQISNQLVDSNPEFSEGWNKRATIHYLLGNPDLSVADIQKTLSLEPRHFGAISGLGLIFHQRRDFEGALEAFKQVLLIAPNSQNAKASLERVKRDMQSEI